MPPPGAVPSQRSISGASMEVVVTSIAVIGSGRIGGGLARKWAAGGHAVTFGARSPETPALVELAEQIGAAREVIDSAVAQSDVVVFAIPGGEMAGTLSR